MYDTKLCFGAAKAPSITESITRILKRRGFKGVCVYLDDFIIVADTYEECKYAFDCLVDLLGSLGFTINLMCTIKHSNFHVCLNHAVREDLLYLSRACQISMVRLFSFVSHRCPKSLYLQMRVLLVVLLITTPIGLCCSPFILL